MNVLHYMENHSKKLSREHFVHLVKIALADGKMDSSENELLYRFGKKLSLTEQEIESIIKTPGKTTFHPTYKLSDRFEQIYDIVKMLLIIGKADDQSIRMANCYAIAAGFEVDETDLIIELLMDGIIKGKNEEDLLSEYKIKRLTW